MPSPMSSPPAAPEVERMFKPERYRTPGFHASDPWGAPSTYIWRRTPCDLTRRRCPMKRLPTVLAVLGLVISAPAVSAAERTAQPAHPAQVNGVAFPTSFPLPDGWQPEGIATGPGPVAFFGSRVDGSIFRVDLRTGQGEVFSQGPGTPSTGLKTDRRGRLFVSGASGGDARVIDLRSGEILKSYQLTTNTSFVNDVILTLGAAWFTDSLNPQIYKVSLRHGGLPDAAETIPF